MYYSHCVALPYQEINVDGLTCVNILIIQTHYVVTFLLYVWALMLVAPISNIVTRTAAITDCMDGYFFEDHKTDYRVYGVCILLLSSPITT